LLLSGDPPLEIDPDTSELVQVADNSGDLRFAVAPVMSPERTTNEYRVLAGHLATELETPVKVVQRKTYAQVNELLRVGSVQVALICTGAYLDSRAEALPLEVLVVPYYQSGPVYRSLILAREDGPYTSFEQLVGLPFALSDPLSLSGHYYPLSAVMEMGRSPADLLSRAIYTYSHDASITALLDGIVEGAAVDSLVYEYEVRRDPTISQRLEILHRSPPLGISPIVVPSSVDHELRERLRSAFLHMGDSPTGREVLDSLGVSRFDLPPEGLYDDVYERYMRVRKEVERSP